jgi:hypothetical protein
MNIPTATTSRQKRMTCWNCPIYDRATFHCRDGKTNPRKKTDSITVAELLGLRALCHYNLYRDAIAQRTHFPNDPATIHASARVIRKRWFTGIEPDIAANIKAIERERTSE